MMLSDVCLSRISGPA